MEFHFVKKPKIEKCRVCQKVIRDNIRTIPVAIKESFGAVESIKICEKCIYRLPKDLVKDLLNPSIRSDYDFGNKILSAFLTNKYRNLYDGCIALIKIPHANNGENNFGCSYRFVKSSEPKLCYQKCKNIYPTHTIDSVYLDGNKISAEDLK